MVWAHKDAPCAAEGDVPLALFAILTAFPVVPQRLRPGKRAVSALLAGRGAAGAMGVRGGADDLRPAFGCGTGPLRVGAIAVPVLSALAAAELRALPIRLKAR